MAQVCRQIGKLCLTHASHGLTRGSVALCSAPVIVLQQQYRTLYEQHHTFPGESFYYQHPEESLDDAPKSGMVPYGSWKSDRRKLQNGEWPWNTGVRARLPEHYKRYWTELYSREPIPVHYHKDPQKYTVDEFGIRTPVINKALPILFIKHSDEGLWGGEGLVIGTRKRNNDPMKPRTPRVWKPKLHRHTFYSEILDKYMFINVTRRTLLLIDDAFGFDYYILKTHQVDLRSKLGMILKREMLLALANETLYPNNPDKRQEIIDKYKQYIIPAEEAEWLGLTIGEAEEKQLRLEEEQHQASIKPLKYKYAEQLIQDLKDDKIKTDQSSWWSKVSPFKEKQETES